MHADSLFLISCSLSPPRSDTFCVCVLVPELVAPPPPPKPPPPKIALSNPPPPPKPPPPKADISNPPDGATLTADIDASAALTLSSTCQDNAYVYVCM